MAMDPQSGKWREADKSKGHGSGLLIDLNFPAPGDSEENYCEPDAEEQKEKKKSLVHARQYIKRKEKIKNDPIYAAARHETQYKSHKKWKLKRDANLTEEKRRELKEQRKTSNHKYYLTRKSKFGGHNTKEEQEVAEIFERFRRGEQVTPEDRQKATDFRRKRRSIAQKYRWKKKNLDVGTKNKPA